MPAKPPLLNQTAATRLVELGQQIRAQRKALKVNANAVAEAAGMSRVTFYRIEKGEPAVTMGAYMNALTALGLNVDVSNSAKPGAGDPTADREAWLPARIRLADYPQLKQLAWQIHAEALSPNEAWDIYTRNQRHMDESALTAGERQLVAALQIAFGGGQHV